MLHTTLLLRPVVNNENGFCPAFRGFTEEHFRSKAGVSLFLALIRARAVANRCDPLIVRSVPKDAQGPETTVTQSLPRTVLVIEDEHQMRTLLVLMLEQFGYQVFEAAHAQEASGIWKRHHAAIDVIVSDIWLPGITGPELIHFFRRDRPSLRCIFISGMSPEVQPEMRKLTRGCQIIRKPFQRDELLRALETLMAPER
jgi:CheY-like chemotaxis protein